MFYLFAISEECKEFLDATGADLWEVGCRAAHSGSEPDVLGGFLFFGLIVAGLPDRKITGAAIRT